MNIIPLIGIIATAYIVVALLKWYAKEDIKDALFAGSITWIIIVLVYTYLMPYETVYPQIVFAHTILVSIFIQYVIWQIKSDKEGNMLYSEKKKRE